jgi:hypothetical protein
VGGVSYAFYAITDIDRIKNRRPAAHIPLKGTPVSNFKISHAGGIDRGEGVPAGRFLVDRSASMRDDEEGEAGCQSKEEKKQGKVQLPNDQR